DQPNAGAGWRKLRHARDRPVLGTVVVYRPRRKHGLGRRRLSTAILSTVGTALLSRGHGAFGGVGQFAFLPLRRRAEDRPGRRRGGFCALHIVENHRRFEQSGTDGPAGGGRIASRRRQRDGLDCAPLPGGRVMARAATHSRLSRRRSWWAALVIFAAAATVVAGSAGVSPALAQLLGFPPRPKPPRTPGRSQEQILGRGGEMNYEYGKGGLSAVGNGEVDFGSSAVEAERVVCDQKSKRRHAEGNVQLTEGDGTVTHGEIMDLSDDYRDGFVDSLRLDAPE